jgi:hypothetical protein
MRLLPLILALSLPLAARAADDLDKLLTQPPSASLSVEDAKHRIDTLRALAAEHPDRATEIEAYLIPFVRVAEPPPPLPTPTPSPTPATPKPLLLVRSSDGEASLVRAVSVQRQGDVVMVVSEKGTRAVIQASTIVGQLPWFTDEEIESEAANLADAAGRYETFALVVPALAPQLKREAVRFRGVRQAKADAALKERAANEQRVEQVTSARYDPAAGYTTAALARMLLDAEAVRRELPLAAERIDAWRAPFHEHFTRLLGGFSHLDGKWVSNADIARQAYEKRQEQFLGGLDYRVGSEALPAGIVRGFLEPLAIKLGFAAAVGFLAIAFGWRRPILRVAGALLVVIAATAAAVMFFLATRDPPLLAAAIPPGDGQQVIGILSQAAGLETRPDGSQSVTDAALNGFAARHIAIDGGPAEVERQALVVRFLPGRLVLFEMVRCMGLSWIVRIDLAAQSDGGTWKCRLEGARIGALACPRPLAESLWKNLEPQLATILASSRVTEAFVTAPGDGAVELKPAAAR